MKNIKVIESINWEWIAATWRRDEPLPRTVAAFAVAYPDYLARVASHAGRNGRRITPAQAARAVLRFLRALLADEARGYKDAAGRQVTHRLDPAGHYRQVVSPETLKAVLDADGSDYSPPAGFGPEDEWDLPASAS